MARRGGSTAALLFLCVVAAFSFSTVTGATVLHDEDTEPRRDDGDTEPDRHDQDTKPGRYDEDREPRRVPLYVYKARLYLERQKAYERTMEARMQAMAQSLNNFSTGLYLQHVKASGEGNVLLSPLSAYVSLVMALTASQGTTKREILTTLGLTAEGRGIHTAVQRALKSLLDDDTDDVNDNLSTERDLSGMQNDDAGVDLTYRDLENIIRNDYLMDSSISYNTGQSHIKYSTAVKTGSDHVDDPQPDSLQSDTDLFVRVANGMFHSEEVALSQHFSNRLVSLYGAPPMAMHPEQPETSVNLWVDAVTRGTVPDMLASDSVTNHTLLVLASVLSFGGSWETNFDERETIPLDFKTQDRGVVMAQSMYRTGNYSVKNLPELGAKVIELPYANARYSLFVFLPCSTNRLGDVERLLKTHKLQAHLHDMPQPRTTIVLLPKFHLRSRLSLKAELKKQGVRKLFKKRQADLRRMTGEDVNSMYLNDFFHYAAFEVNEGKKSDAGKNTVTIATSWDSSISNGTVSASNSSVHIHISDADSKPSDDGGEEDDENDDEFYDYEDYDYDSNNCEEEQALYGEPSNYFIAEKPFLFVVKDKQYDLILLMGRVTNPLH